MFKITLDSVSTDEIAYEDIDSQTAYFKNLASVYGCECIDVVDVGSCYSVTYKGERSKLSKLVEERYGGDDNEMIYVEC